MSATTEPVNKALHPVTYDPHRLPDAVRADLERPDRGPSADVPGACTGRAVAARYLLRCRGRLWRVRHNGLKVTRLIEAGDRPEAYATFAAWAQTALGKTINPADCRADQLKG